MRTQTDRSAEDQIHRDHRDSASGTFCVRSDHQGLCSADPLKRETGLCQEADPLNINRLFMTVRRSEERRHQVLGMHPIKRNTNPRQSAGRSGRPLLDQGAGNLGDAGQRTGGCGRASLCVLSALAPMRSVYQMVGPT
jgi:hypothetical protein